MKQADSADILTVAELQEFVRTSRSTIIPELVAAMIAKRTPALESPAERVELLRPLIADLRERLRQRNIPLPLSPEGVRNASAKERRMARSLAILETQVADGLFRVGKFPQALSEGRVAGESCAAVEDFWNLTATMDIRAIAMRELGDYSGALEMQRQSYRVGAEQDNREIMQRSLYNQSVTLQRLGRLNEAIDVLYKVIETGAYRGEERAVHGLAYNRIARSLIGLNDPHGAVEIARYALTIVGNDFPTVSGSLLVSLTEACMAGGDYSTGFETAKNGLALVRSFGNKPLEVHLLTSLGMIQAHLGDTNQAKMSFEEAISLCDEIGYTSEAARERVVVSLAGILGDNGEFGEAMEIFRQLLEGDQAWHADPDRFSWVLANAADLYVKLGDFEQGERMYLRALEKCSKASVSHGISGTLLKLGKFYRDRGERAKAVESFQRLLNLCEIESGTQGPEEATRALAALYEEAGDTDRALAYLKTCFDLTVQSKDRMLDHRLTRMRVEHNVEQHRKQTERERRHREEVEEELQKTTLALLEKSELIGSFRSKVKGILRELEAAEIPALNNALHQIIRHVTEKADPGTHGRLLLGSVKEEFYKELRRIHPDLTPGQIKLCGLIRGGMETHEILGLLHITISGLNKRRYRLRQRLGLETAMNLERYLAGIG